MRVQQKRRRPSLCCNNSRSKSNTKDFEDRERVCRAIKRKIFSKLWVISQRKGFDVKTVSRRKMWAASLACGKDLDTVLQEDSSVFGHVPIFSFTFKNRPTAHCWPVNCSFPDCWIFYARSSFIFPLSSFFSFLLPLRLSLSFWDFFGGKSRSSSNVAIDPTFCNQSNESRETKVRSFSMTVLGRFISLFIFEKENIYFFVELLIKKRFREFFFQAYTIECAVFRERESLATPPRRTHSWWSVTLFGRDCVGRPVAYLGWCLLTRD